MIGPVNLGAPLSGTPDPPPEALWSITVKLRDGTMETCVFTRDEALEMARRITEFYGPPR